MRKVQRRPQSDVLQRELPGWLNGVLILGTFATVLWLEQTRPLRRRTESKVGSDARNLAIAGLSALAIRLTERPVTSVLTQVVHRKRWGIVSVAGSMTATSLESRLITITSVLGS